MRNILCFVLCIPSLVQAQQTTSYGAFKIDNVEIIYQKVLTHDSATTEKLVEYFKTVPQVSNVQTNNGTITADLTDLTVDYRKFQFAQVNTPPIIQTGKFSGKVKIESKANKYRVSVTSIVMTGSMGYKKIASPEPMTNYATANSGTLISREWCKPTMLGLLDQAISDVFQYKQPEKDSDW